MAMTEAAADRLAAQLDGLTLYQFSLFWRWVTLAYFERCGRATPDEVLEARRQRERDA